MRIALDCRSVFPGRGGIGRYTECLARHLSKSASEHEYLLFVTERQTEPIALNGNVVQMSFKVGMIDEIWEQIHLPSILKEYNVDLYHNPCFSLPVIRTTRSQIATVHDVVFRARPELVDSRLRSYLDRWTEHAVDTADAIITDSQFSKDDIVRWYGADPSRIHVVYSGVEPLPRPSGDFRSTIRRKYDLPQKIILYTGAVEPKKNIDRLLKAFALLLKEENLQDTKLVIAGGGGGNSYNIQAAIDREGVREKVATTGYVEESDLAALMHSATLFVFPSLYEGFGLPPLEAMLCGIPTVVSDSSCLPEIVGDAALIAPAESVEGLADQIVRGLTDPQLRKSLLRKGRLRAREFTWERAVKGIMDVYESVTRTAA